jgi:3-deoxy-7-phosphoheptulonate synthase
LELISKLPTPDELKANLTPSPLALKTKAERDAEIKAIIKGEIKKILLIVGPCSAHDSAAVLEYVKRLAELSRKSKIKDKLLIIPRVYTAKPRSASKGFMGMLHEKNGLYKTRKLHLDILEQTGLSAADELLYPALLPYFDDLVSYFAIGARSALNQEHRLVAGGITVPVGIKNPLSGSLADMTAAISAAQSPQDFIYRNHVVKTEGNPLAHGVLRGGKTPNYHQNHLNKTLKLFKKAKIKNPAIIIDTSHGNSNKNPNHQRDVALNALESYKKDPSLAELIKGLMIESFIEAGSQDPSGKTFGQSITDPCLCWPQTEKLILEIAGMLY